MIGYRKAAPKDVPFVFNEMSAVLAELRVGCDFASL
jgi:hypothetical protein